MRVLTLSLSIVLSMVAAIALAADGSNPPWYPSLMASEAYDSGRTRLFEQAQFTGSFNQPNVVDVLTTPPQDVSRGRPRLLRLW